MGLDITAYTGLLKLTPLPLEDDEAMETLYDQAYDLNQVVIWENPAFPGRAEGLDSKHLYQAFQKGFRFRAGSYSGYGCYRDNLTQFAGIDPVELRANPFKFEGYRFWEQIWFSDCEGAIGPVASKKLFQDYCAKEHEFKETFADDEWMLDLYDDWKTAFGMASSNGAVIFG